MRHDGIDLLRGIAAFCIVRCHLQLVPATDAGVRIDELCDMNVGLFAVLSGFFMWKAANFEDFREYVKKRFARIVPVYFVWSLVFIIAGFIFDYIFRHSINPKWHNAFQLPKVIFCGNASTHLWFLVCLFYVQTAIACLARLLAKIKWFPVLIIGLVLAWASSIYSGLWFFRYPMRMLAFVLSGCALKMRYESKPFVRGHGFFVYIPVILLMLTAHYVSGHCIVPVFVKDWLLALLLIIAFLHIPDGRMGNLPKILGSTSMGVYLIHPMITVGALVVVRKIFAVPFGVDAIVIDWIICYALSLPCAIVLNRISWTRKWVT